MVTMVTMVAMVAMLATGFRLLDRPANNASPKRIMTRTLILACALFFVAAPAHAVVERECLVALQAKSGWGKAQKRTVYFMTGLELSRITTVLKIDFGQNYAVITNGRSLPTVTRIDTVLPGVRREFTDADFVRLFVNHHERSAVQIDGEGRNLRWQLRGRTIESWIDDDMPSMSQIIL
jgi:hypothetical protein